MSAPLTAGTKAVVLLSGGLDSATALAWARDRGALCHAAHRGLRAAPPQVEIDAARQVARALDARSHRLIAVDLRAIGGSALTSDVEVPRRPRARNDGPRHPGHLCAGAQHGAAGTRPGSGGDAGRPGDRGRHERARLLWLSGLPSRILSAFEEVARLGTRAGVEGARFSIHAPLISLDKAGIIRLGLSLGVDYGLTHSCYDPDPEGVACGACDACRLRLLGFEKAGVPDPVRYRTVPR